MSYSRTFSCLVIAITISCFFVFVMHADQPNTARKSTKDFMRAKLSSSQRVMEGLVTEKSELIRKGAQEMKKMSEHAEWPRSRDKVYEHFSQKFRGQCDKLVSQAQKRDFETAQHSFLSLSNTCFDCHNYVRGSFRVTRDESDPSGPVQLIPTEWDDMRKSHRKHKAPAESL